MAEAVKTGLDGGSSRSALIGVALCDLDGPHGRYLVD